MIAAYAPGAGLERGLWFRRARLRARRAGRCRRWPRRTTVPASSSPRSTATAAALPATRAKNTAGAAVAALAEPAGDHPWRLADHSQGPATRERHRQQRRQRGGRRRGRRTNCWAGRRAPTCCWRARWRASRPAAAPHIPITSHRRSTAVSSSRGALTHRIWCGCRCPTGWPARVLHPHVEVHTGTARALMGDTCSSRTPCGNGATWAPSSHRCSR